MIPIRWSKYSICFYLAGIANLTDKYSKTIFCKPYFVTTLPEVKKQQQQQQHHFHKECHGYVGYFLNTSVKNGSLISKYGSM